MIYRTTLYENGKIYGRHTGTTPEELTYTAESNKKAKDFLKSYMDDQKMNQDDYTISTIEIYIGVIYD